VNNGETVQAIFSFGLVTGWRARRIGTCWLVWIGSLDMPLWRLGRARMKRRMDREAGRSVFLKLGYLHLLGVALCYGVSVDRLGIPFRPSQS
jgi:hypothetical protein